MTGVNFMGEESTSPNNPKKFRSVKYKIHNAGHLGNEYNGEKKCMLHGLDGPWIGLWKKNLDKLFICKLKPLYLD